MNPLTDFFTWLKYLSDKEPITLAFLTFITFGVVLLAGAFVALALLKLRDTQAKQEGKREENIFETINVMAANITRLIDQIESFRSILTSLSKGQSDLTALEAQRMEYRIKENTAQQAAQIELAKNLYQLNAQMRELREMMQSIGQVK